MPRVPRGGCGTSAAATDMPWAWLGQKSSVIASSATLVETTIDMDSASGYGFFTNDTATFSNGASTAGFHGISALVGGVYEAHFINAFIRNAALAHGAFRAALTTFDPNASTDSDFDTQLLATNIGYTAAGIDGVGQLWQTFTMHLTNIPDNVAPANIPGSTTWVLGVAQDSGGNATAFPSLYVKRIAAALPGGIS